MGRLARTGRKESKRLFGGGGNVECGFWACKREWAYARPYAHSRDRMAALHLTELVNNVPGCCS